MKALAQHRTTAVLLVVALGLAVVTVIDRATVSTGEAEGRKRQLLGAWRADVLSRVDVSGTQGSFALVAERQEGEEPVWHIEQDGRTSEADPQGVGQFLAALELASWERRASDGQELGLDAPALRIGIDMGELDYQLVFGALAPMPEGGRYVAVEGGGRARAHLVVTRELFAALDVDPTALRVRHLVPYMSPEIERFTLTSGAATLTLERGSWGGGTAGAFLLKAPDAAPVRASRRTLDAWLVALGRLDAEKFVPVPDAFEARGRLELQPRDASPKALFELGGSSPACGALGLVVRRAPDPVAGCAPAEAVQALLATTAADFADEHLIGSPEGDILEVALASGDKKLELAREGQGWHVRAPEAAAADPAAAQRWLEELLAARGERAAAEELAPLGLAPPRGTVRVVALPERVGDGRERVEELDIGATDGGFTWVRRADDGAVLRVAVEAARALEPRAIALRPLRVHELELGRFLALRVDCGAKQALARAIATGHWTLSDPPEGARAGLGADDGLATDLAEQLARLEAIRWVADEPDESMGLERPWCRIEADVQLGEDEAGAGEEQRTIAVLLGKETSGGYYGRLASSRAVFVAPRVFGASARGWLLDRSDVRPELAPAKRIVLRHADGREVVFERHGDAWRAASGDVSPSLVVDALSTLAAEGVVRLGPPEGSDGTESPLLTVRVEGKGGSEELRVGAGDVWRESRVFFVRRSVVDATFAVSQAKLRPLLDAF